MGQLYRENEFRGMKFPLPLGKVALTRFGVKMETTDMAKD